MKKLSIGTLVALTTTVLLSGCALYFGDENDRGGDGWGGTSEPGAGSPGMPPGEFECQSNADCAAGCYCGTSGFCEEAGFCTQNTDCGEGYECNEERSSCEPVPTCACTNDDEATAQGYDYCDETAGTCQTGTDPAITCAGEATCAQAPPSCASGEVPLLGADGCWTGSCLAVAQCSAPPVCSHINDAASCGARSDCAATVNGINCTKQDGSACQVGDSNCSCEQLVFAACRSTTP